MGKFVNTATGVTFSVDDSKDYRYSGEGFKSADENEAPAAKKAAARKTAAKKTAAAPQVEPGTGTPPEPDPTEND